MGSGKNKAFLTILGSIAARFLLDKKHSRNVRRMRGCVYILLCSLTFLNEPQVPRQLRGRILAGI